MGLFGCEYLEIRGGLFADYICKYSRQQLDSRTAQDICSTSRYVDCADYKNATRCFITSAVCLTMGKPNDCEELMVMRNFRDNWLCEQPGGIELIEKYYKIAPGIVKSINEDQNRLLIFKDIYKQFILPCVESTKNCEYEKSKTIYLEMLETLTAQYVS